MRDDPNSAWSHDAHYTAYIEELVGQMVEKAFEKKHRAQERYVAEGGDLDELEKRLFEGEIWFPTP